MARRARRAFSAIGRWWDRSTAVSVPPSKRTRALYWSTFWRWHGTAPNGAYAGFQTALDHNADGTLPGLAIFSIWDATAFVAARGATCGPFEGEGHGMHCRAPLTVIAN